MNVFKLIKAMFTSAPRAEPQACADRIRSGAAVLIDVRESSEWAEGVAQNAVLLPLHVIALQLLAADAAIMGKSQSGPRPRFLGWCSITLVVACVLALGWSWLGGA